MNWKTTVGIMVAVTGLGLIGWTGYRKIQGETIEATTGLAGLLLSLAGAFLIRRGRQE
jgi:hypothetical protein